MVEVEAWVAEYLHAEAEWRRAMHEGHASSRPLSPDYELVGFVGEFEFGRLIGRMPDFSPRPGGDAGVDFVVHVPLTVDVKCARKAMNLIHEQGKTFADIYVLAEFNADTRRALIIGWAYGIALKAAPVRDFGYGVLNHYIPRENLRPIGELIVRINACAAGP